MRNTHDYSNVQTLTDLPHFGVPATVQGFVVPELSLVGEPVAQIEGYRAMTHDAE